MHEYQKYARIFRLPEEDIAHTEYDIFTGMLTVTYGIDQPQYKQKKVTRKATKEFADFFTAPIFAGKSVDYILTAYLKAKGMDPVVREGQRPAKVYYTSSDPVFDKITMGQFIETEVEERGNYTHTEVKKWMGKYGLSMNDLAIWVSPLKWVANRYTLLAQEWDKAKFIPESEMNVSEIRSDEGFIIPESDDGEEGYLFVFKKSLNPVVREAVNHVPEHERANKIIEEIKASGLSPKEKRKKIGEGLKALADGIDRSVYTAIKDFRPLGIMSEIGMLMGAQPRKGVRIDTPFGAYVFDNKRVPSKEMVDSWYAQHKEADTINTLAVEYAFGLEAIPNTVTGNFRVVEHARRLRAQGLLTPEEEKVLGALERYWEAHPELDRKEGYGVWGYNLDITVPERFKAKAAKEPWEMTYREFANFFEEVWSGQRFTFAERVGKPLGIQSQAGEPYHMIKGRRIGYSGSLPRDRWRLAIVDKALSEGKKVPEEVLAELAESLKKEKEKLGGKETAEPQGEKKEAEITVGSPYEVKATVSFIQRERVWSTVLEDSAGYCYGAQNYPRLQEALDALKTKELEQDFDRESARRFYLRQIGLDPEDLGQLKQIMEEYSEGHDPRRGIRITDILYTNEVRAQIAMLEHQYTSHELNSLDIEALKKIALAKGAKTTGKKDDVVKAILQSQGEKELPPASAIFDIYTAGYSSLSLVAVTQMSDIKLAEDLITTIPELSKEDALKIAPQVRALAHAKAKEMEAQEIKAPAPAVDFWGEVKDLKIVDIEVKLVPGEGRPYRHIYEQTFAILENGKKVLITSIIYKEKDATEALKLGPEFFKKRKQYYIGETVGKNVRKDTFLNLNRRYEEYQAQKPIRTEVLESFPTKSFLEPKIRDYGNWIRENTYGEAGVKRLQTGSYEQVIATIKEFIRKYYNLAPAPADYIFRRPKYQQTEIGVDSLATSFFNVAANGWDLAESFKEWEAGETRQEWERRLKEAPVPVPQPPTPSPAAKVRSIQEIKQQAVQSIQQAKTIDELKEILKNIGFMPLPEAEKRQVMDLYQNKYSILASERPFGERVPVEEKPKVIGAPTPQELAEAEMRRKAEEGKKLRGQVELGGAVTTAARLGLFEPGAMEKAKAEAEARKRMEQLGLPYEIHPFIKKLAESTQDVLKFGSKRKETLEDLVLARYVRYCPAGTIVDNRNIVKVPERWWVYPGKLRSCMTEVQQKIASAYEQETGEGVVKEAARSNDVMKLMVRGYTWKARMSNGAVFEWWTPMKVGYITAKEELLKAANAEYGNVYTPRDIVSMWETKGGA